MKTQEQIIIEKLSNGDESGLRLLFDLYYAPLCVYAFKYLDSFENAEDIVQEAFITLWNKQRLINFTGSIKSYLFSIVRNNSINLIKKDSKYRFEDVEDISNKIIEENFESEELDKRKEKLYKEIEKLPEQRKNVFKAIVFERLKYAEVAEDLDVSINTVKTHYSRALKQLRSSIDTIILIMMI